MTSQLLADLLAAYRDALPEELRQRQIVLADALEEADDERADVVRAEHVTGEDILYVVKTFGMSYEETARIAADLAIDGRAEIKNNTDELQVQLQEIVR
jgi:broad-specificity NMP kinase